MFSSFWNNLCWNIEQKVKINSFFGLGGGRFWSRLELFSSLFCLCQILFSLIPCNPGPCHLSEKVHLDQNFAKNHIFHIPELIIRYLGSFKPFCSMGLCRINFARGKFWHLRDGLFKHWFHKIQVNKRRPDSPITIPLYFRIKISII